MTDEKDLEEKKEDQELPCQTCPDESTGCRGCSGNREKASTWWYIIALLVILILALFLRRQGGST